MPHTQRPRANVGEQPRAVGAALHGAAAHRLVFLVVPDARGDHPGALQVVELPARHVGGRDHLQRMAGHRWRIGDLPAAFNKPPMKHAGIDLPEPDAKCVRELPPLLETMYGRHEREQSLGYLGWLPDDVLRMVACRLFMTDLELMSELPAPIPAICQSPAVQEAFCCQQLLAFDEIRLLNWIRLATAGGGGAALKSKISSSLLRRFRGCRSIKRSIYAAAYKLLWDRHLPNATHKARINADAFIAVASGVTHFVGDPFDRIYPALITFAIWCRDAAAIRMLHPIRECFCSFESLYLVACQRGRHIVDATLQAFSLDSVVLGPLYDCMIRVGNERDVARTAELCRHAALEATKYIPSFRDQSTVAAICENAHLTIADIVHVLGDMDRQNSPHLGAAVSRLCHRLLCGGASIAARLICENIRKQTFVEFVLATFESDHRAMATIFFGIYDYIVYLESHGLAPRNAEVMLCHQKTLQHIAEKHSFSSEHFAQECAERIIMAPSHIATMIVACANCAWSGVCFACFDKRAPLSAPTITTLK